VAFRNIFNTLPVLFDIGLTHVPIPVPVIQVLVQLENDPNRMFIGCPFTIPLRFNWVVTQDWAGLLTVKRNRTHLNNVAGFAYF